MKTIQKTIATILVASVFALTGCGKENIQPFEPVEPDTIENIYEGTAWTAHLENTYNYDGVLRMDLTYDVSLDFLDSVSGELFHEFYIDIPSHPSASQYEAISESFTYTFHDDTVILNCVATDDETGEEVEYSYSLRYDKDANTLTLDFDDENMTELMGTSVMVFTKRDLPAKYRGQQPKSGRPSWKGIPDAALAMIILMSFNRL